MQNFKIIAFNIFFLLSLFLTVPIKADFISDIKNRWDSFTQCFENLCSCGCPEFTEIWGSENYGGYPDGSFERVFKGTSGGGNNCNCPPYNKSLNNTLHSRDGCVKQFNYPGETLDDFNLFDYCVEHPNDSTYFNPTIRVRTQQCNALSCFSQSSALNATGECVIFADNYGVPIQRFCARIANGPNPAQGTNAAYLPDDGFSMAQCTEDNTGLNFYASTYLDENGIAGIITPPLVSSIPDKDPTPSLKVLQPIISPITCHHQASVNFCTDATRSNCSNVFSKTNSQHTSTQFKLNGYSKATCTDALNRSFTAQSYLDKTGEYNIYPPYDQKITLPINCIDVNGKNISTNKLSNGSQFVNQPKICAYLDPAFITGDFLDPLDIKYTSQPFHYNSSGTSLFAQILIMLGAISPNAISLDKLGDIMQGQGLNHDVDSRLGCVLLPLGPLPPPYPPILSSNNASLSAMQICPQYPINPPIIIQTPVSTTSDLITYGVNVVSANGCAYSSAINNSINNSVRIGIDNILPICSQGQTPDTNDCADLSKFNDLLINLHNNSYDLIQSCDGTNANKNACVTLPKQVCSNIECNSDLKFRVNYSMQNNNKTIKALNTIYCDPSNITTCMQANYYTYSTSLAGCPKPSDDSFPCVFISGINVGSYQDLLLKFSTEETSGDTNDLVTSATIKDAHDNNYNVEARIARVYNTNAAVPQHTEQICAYNITNERVPLGCFARAPLPPLTTSISSTSTVFNPSIIAKFTIGDLHSSTTISPPQIASGVPLSVANATPAPNATNLLGTSISAEVMDDTQQIQPFATGNVINPNTIQGNYKNWLFSKTTSPNELTNPYLDGLEYLKGQYIRGGTQICITSRYQAKCPLDITQCILTQGTGANIGQKASQRVPPGIANSPTYNNTSTTLTRDQYYNVTTGNPIPQIPDGANASNYYSSNGSYTPLLNSSNYCFSSSAAFDSTKCSVRTKTASENSLCEAIPQLFCAAITTPSSASGYASWPSVQTGELSSGTCDSSKGYLPPLNGLSGRYCLLDYQGYANQTNISGWKWDALTDKNTCCAPCNDDGAGNAKWTFSGNNQYTGTCNRGYAYNSSITIPSTRSCSVTSNSCATQLSAINASSQTCSIMHCPARTIGSRTLPQTNINSSLARSTYPCGAPLNSTSGGTIQCLLLDSKEVPDFYCIYNGQTGGAVNNWADDSNGGYYY